MERGALCRAGRLPLLAYYYGICSATLAAVARGADDCGGVAISEWTSASLASKGYHALCFGAEDASCPSGGDGACASDGQTRVDVHWDGTREAETLSIAAPGSLLDLEKALAEHREPANPSRHKRITKALEKKDKARGIFEKKDKARGIFAFFAVPSAGEAPVRIRSADELQGLVLAFEGGAFIWPGIEVGFRRTVNFTVKHDSSNLVLDLLTRSMQPVVIEVSGFLEEEECSHLIKKASPHVKASIVSKMDHDVGKADTNWRTSSTYFMRSDDNILRRLDWRVSALTVTGKDHQEHAQILRYEKGQSYDSHTDYFDPNLYKKDQMVQGLTKKGLFNRLATVFFYLTDVEDGGETNFPRAGGGAQVTNFKDCSAGVSIKPQRGRIIIFYSQQPAGQLDPLSLHSGCPVKSGTKWSANKWIWNKPMEFTPKG